MVALSVPLKCLQSAIRSKAPWNSFFLLQKCYFQSFSIMKVNLQWSVGYRIFIFLFILKVFVIIYNPPPPKNHQNKVVGVLKFFLTFTTKVFCKVSLSPKY